MNNKQNLSEAEQNTLQRARRLLGDNLASFLLSGLGETEINQRRTYIAALIRPHEGAFTYQFEMVNESERGLPVGREPLVLAALLGLLYERQPPDGKVTFREGGLLEDLEWPMTPNSRRLVKRALEKYLSTAYYLIDDTLPQGERIYDRYAGFRRLIVSYETNSTLRPQHRINPDRMTKVQFLPDFFNDISSKGKYFLGIEFQRLNEISLSAN